MNTLVKVARYHLVRPYRHLVLPWGILAFTLAVNIIAFKLTPTGQATVPSAHGAVSVAHTRGRDTGALVSFFIFFFVLGVQSIGRSFPFGMTLGVSRRSYYLGTALLVTALAFADGLGLAGLQAVERATDGWGVHMSFFRVAYLLNGPWYLTWLTSFVGLALLFLAGMWFGIVYQRWGPFGTIAFIAAQVTAVLAAVLVVALTGAGHFFTGLTAAGLTGLLAVLAVALLAGGHATIRRATI